MFALSAPIRRCIFSLRAFLLVVLLCAIGERAYAATCVVTNTNSSGAGSLANCISNANSGDTIDATGVTGTILGNFSISQSISIIGPFSGGLTIRGSNVVTNASVFIVYPSVSLTIANVTVTGGNGAVGGGFLTYDSSLLTLINTVVTANVLTNSQYSATGGGILAHGPVTLIASTVTGNSAAGSVAYGGGVYITNGTLTLACGSTVTGNTAAFDPNISGPFTTSSTIFCVTSLADNGATGVGEFNDVLGQAIGVANSSVYFVGISGTIGLTRALPGIAQTLNIIGPGAKFLTVDGQAGENKPIFQIFANRTVGISGLTITKAASQQEGGGIYTEGNLTLDKSIVSGNSSSSQACGAGIYEGTSGTLTVMNSAINENSCLSDTASGGGIHAIGPLVVVNSTIAGNVGDGIFTSQTASLVNTTITGNHSSGRAGVESTSFSTPPTFVNTVIEGNSGRNGYNDAYLQDGYTDGGGNVINASPKATSDPKLLAVNNSSGTLLHYIPLPGSPAICAGVGTATAGSAPAVPTTDQRGAPRPHAYGSTTCYDSGSIQSAYSSIAFTNSTNGYSGNANTAVAPAPTVAVIENGVNLGGVPIALSFSGSSPVTASGLTATTVAGTGATFSNLQVNTSGSYSISTAASASSTTATLSAAGVSPAATLPASVATVAINYPTPTIAGISPIFGPAAGGTVVTITGTNFTGATIVSFGSAQAASYTVNSATQITATSPSGSGTVDVIVTNPTTSSAPSTADNFTYVSLTLSAPKTLTGQAGAAYSQGVSASGGTSPYTYSVPANTLPGGLTLSATGAITGTPTAVGTFAVTVTVKDSSNSTAQSSFKFSISAPTITVATTAAFPALTVGVAPTLAFTATGGTATYAYTVASGAVPAGLTLNSDGTVSGTPTTAGSYNFSVKATDSTTGSGAPYSRTSQTYSGTVSKGTAQVQLSNLTLTYTASPLSPTVQTTPKGLTTTQSYTGTGSTTYGPTSIPPTNAGTYSVTATVVDPNYTGTQTSSFTIKQATLTLTADNKSRAFGAANPTFTGTLSGNVGGDTFTESFSTTATSVSNPGNYAIVPSASGTNLANYAVSVTNGTLSIAAPVITVGTTGVFPTLTVGVTPNLAFSAAGGTAPYVYAVASGVLPVGLTMNFNGAVSGMPTTAGAYSFAVKATDSTAGPGQPYGAVSQIYSGSVGKGSAAVTFTAASLTPTYSAVPVNASATVTPGGVPASELSYTYTGTGATAYGPFTTGPTTVGTYSVTATLTDTNYTGTQSTSFTISPATLTLTADNKSRVYGVANPVFTGTINNVQGTDAIIEGFTTSAKITSDVGSYSIVPSAAGVNLTNYTANISNGSLTVFKADTTATVVPSVLVLPPNGTFSVTATVTSVTSGTPSGTVTFFDNGVQIGSPVSLRGGVGQLGVQASALAPGIQHSFTATYAGDNLDFNGSSSAAGTGSTVAVLPNDFTLTLNSSQVLTVIPGNTLTYSFNVTPTYTLYPGTVTFSASNLPPGATANFSPASIAANGGPQTVTVSINTVLAQNKLTHYTPIAFGLLLLPLAIRKRRRPRSVFLTVLGLGLIVGITGCGAPNGFFGQVPQNYTVVITATAGTTTHSSTFTLNVQ